MARSGNVNEALLALTLTLTLTLMGSGNVNEALLAEFLENKYYKQESLPIGVNLTLTQTLTRILQSGVSPYRGRT